MFKKREAKVNIRKSNNDTDSSDVDRDATEEEINKNALENVRNRQQSRKRIKHAFSEIPVEDVAKTYQKSDAVKSVESMIKTQFATKSQEEHTQFVGHEKIMEKYINEKLGLSTGNQKSEVALDNNLNQNQDNKDDNEIGLLGTGSGLAEVELPIAYKLSNIEETEKLHKKHIDERNARRLLQGEGGMKNKMDLASFRYQKTYTTPFIPQNRGGGSSSSSSGGQNQSSASSISQTVVGPTVPLPSASGDSGGAGKTGQQQQRGHSNRMRSDDYMMQRFKKTQLHR